MQIAIDHGKDECTVLVILPSRHGRMARAQALQVALRQMGRNPSIGYCLHTVETGEPVTLEELPPVSQKEPS